MNAIRTFALAGALALSAGLAGTGTASATPALGAEFAPQTIKTDTGATPAYYHGHNRLCYVPFYRLARMFGYRAAKRIKFRCFHTHHGL